MTGGCRSMQAEGERGHLQKALCLETECSNQGRAPGRAGSAAACRGQTAWSLGTQVAQS